MHSSRVAHEVESCPRKACEEIHGEQVGLEPIAPRTGGDEVPRRVRSTVADGEHVIQRGSIQRERSGAVHTAPTAVAHCGFLYGSFGCDVAMRWAGWTALRGGALV